MATAAPSTLLGFMSSWFNNQDTSDIDVLLKDDKTLHCHRAVLCSWSTVWAAALTDKKESSLDMTAHDAVTVELCLKYCYGHAVELTDDNLTRVHFFAYQYNLEDLKSVCEQKLLNGISVANCVSLYCYFLKHSFPSMPSALEVVTDFLLNEFTSVVKSEGFLTMDEDAFCELLASAFPIPEDDVLDACNRWLGASPDPRVSMRVLKLVRFPLLSADKLVELRSYSWFQPDLEPRYEFAMRWVLTGQVADSDRRKALRTKLTRGENKFDNDHLTPRPPLLKIESRILDERMKSTLATMLGSNRVGRLLVNSTAGIGTDVFDNAVTGQGPFVVIIKSKSGHVFGAYVEDTFGGDRKWIAGSPNNFLFSLKNVPPQQVVKLNRTRSRHGIYISPGFGLFMGAEGEAVLNAFHGHSTAEGSASKFNFKLAKDSTSEDSTSEDSEDSTSEDSTSELAEGPAFELAPGYEHVGKKTLHGKFGDYTPKFMEVFALPKMAKPTNKPGQGKQ